MYDVLVKISEIKQIIKLDKLLSVYRNKIQTNFLFESDKTVHHSMTKT